jgi:phosphoglycolate phosphatase-like HAD superfamily hydrolase
MQDVRGQKGESTRLSLEDAHVATCSTVLRQSNLCSSWIQQERYGSPYTRGLAVHQAVAHPPGITVVRCSPCTHDLRRQRPTSIVPSLRWYAAPANNPLKQTAAPRRQLRRLPLARGEYHGLARRYLTPSAFLMRPLLNGGTLARRMRGDLFFDLDGTLTDPREGIVGCLRHALRELGMPTPSDDALAGLIGPPLRASLRDLLGSDRAHLVPKALELYRARFGTVGMFENRVYEGIPEGLGALATAGWRLSVVTSKPQTFAVPILEHFRLARYFANVHGSDLSGERSNKADLIAHIYSRRTSEQRPVARSAVGVRLPRRAHGGRGGPSLRDRRRSRFGSHGVYARGGCWLTHTLRRTAKEKVIRSSVLQQT